MAHDFRLLFNAVASERLSQDEPVMVAAERVPHRHQIETTALLRLPDVGQLMNKKCLAAERLGRKVL